MRHSKQNTYGFKRFNMVAVAVAGLLLAGCNNDLITPTEPLPRAPAPTPTPTPALGPFSGNMAGAWTGTFDAGYGTCNPSASVGIPAQATFTQIPSGVSGTSEVSGTLGTSSADCDVSGTLTCGLRGNSLVCELFDGEFDTPASGTVSDSTLEILIADGRVGAVHLHR